MSITGSGYVPAMSDGTRHEEGSVENLVELTKDSRFCMLTTVGADGELISRPMTRQQVDLGVELWFIATRDSRKVRHISANRTVAVTVTSDSSWVSMTGAAEVVDDTEKLRELWSTFAEAWLPGGPEDPNAVLIRVDVEGAEYWSNPGGRIATVISFAKSKITGDPYDGGDHGVIEDI